MTPRSLALVLGLAYLGLGALGLMPGALAGVFPSTPVLGTMHLLLGAGGLAAYAGRASVAAYLRGAAFVFTILALGGMLEGFNHGPLVWVHLASAGLAGFIALERPQVADRRGVVRG